MNDWALRLRQSVEAVVPGGSDVIGLREDIDGETFEASLGAFLQWARVQKLVVDFQLFGGQPIGSLNGEVQAWVARNQQRAGQVVEALNASMFELFGSTIDREKVRAAYTMLDSYLGGRGVRKACATTNYDLALEIGFKAPGYVIWDRFSRQDQLSSEMFDPTMVLPEWDAESIPVLHLHGAVGWYFDEQASTVFRQPYDRPYNRTLGSPVFLPPDPSKDPFSEATVATLWADFDKLLAGASHVLVLGHSLNDAILVKRLREARAEIVLVTPHPDKYLDRIPGAAGVSMEFGPDGWDPGWLRNWIDKGNSALRGV
jgi:hypothetical protein